MVSSPTCAIRLSLVLLCLTSTAWQAWAQGSREDYERAAALKKLTEDKVFPRSVEPLWTDDDSKFHHRVETTPQTFRLMSIDLKTGELAQNVDPNNLVGADAFRPLTRLKRSRSGGSETSIRLGNDTNQPVRVFWVNLQGRWIAYGNLAPQETREQHTFCDHVWLLTNMEREPLAAFEASASTGDARVDATTPAPELRTRRRRENRSDSPDGIWHAFIKDENVFLRNRKSGEEIALSTDSRASDPYVERFHWSPDSTKLVAVREKLSENRQIHLIESSPENQLQPKLHRLDYAKPGDGMPVARPCLFDVKERWAIAISEALYPNAWSISDIRWQPDSQRFTFLYNQRGHQVLRVVAVDASSGEATSLIDEQSETFIDYAHKYFARFLDETQELVWMSERDGWNHLYLHDAESGEVKNQITSGEWVVRGVERIDEQARQIWFRAGGIYAEQDPYHVHFCRVNFDGSGLVILTEGDGTHEVEFSPDGDLLVDTYSRVDLPPVTELRRTSDGTLVGELARADWSLLQQSGWQSPERFVAKGRDDETDIFGVIYRPTNFDPSQKYPVIEKIYAGPQGAFVPKRFAAFHSAQEMAELGFIVVQIDGMGTSQRSKKFHDICWKNLADAGFPDRIRWMQAAAERYPEMDLERVGIFGGSAGGQNALGGLLWHSDFYKVGAADCGCHDNRMDKIWWNELWMGYPAGEHYEEQSNVTQAHRLQGKLLLTVGELDRNVDPASTMQVVDALIKADKDFDLLIMPGKGHGAGESPYGQRRRNDFFVRHLLGVEPRWSAH